MAPKTVRRKIKIFFRKDILILFFIIFNTGIILYRLQQNDFPNKVNKELSIIETSINKGISCYFSVTDDALPSAEDQNFFPKQNSLFFHVTSCKGGLNSREACAVESAARAHPRRQIYVLFSGAVTKYSLESSNLAKLKSFVNIEFARVHLFKYVKKTLLENVLNENRANETKWGAEHILDALKIATLFKYGGVSIEPDVVVVKSFTPLGRNWVARDDDGQFAKVFAIGMGYVGRTFVQNAVSEIMDMFESENYSYNGQAAINKVVNRMCPKVTRLVSEVCKDIKIYGPKHFYPIHYLNYSAYFESASPDFLKNFDKAYSHNFWSEWSHDHVIRKNSAFALKAKKYCPLIYDMYGDNFGT